MFLLKQEDSVFDAFIIIRFNVIFQSLYQIFKLRIVQVTHPLLFSHCKRIHTFRDLISENGFFVKCTVISTDDILLAKSYAISNFSVDFVSNINGSIHYKEHFMHFLDGHVDDFAFRNMSWL